MKDLSIPGFRFGGLLTDEGYVCVKILGLTTLPGGQDETQLSSLDLKYYGMDLTIYSKA